MFLILIVNHYTYYHSNCYRTMVYESGTTNNLLLLLSVIPLVQGQPIMMRKKATSIVNINMYSTIKLLKHDTYNTG